MALLNVVLAPRLITAAPATDSAHPGADTEILIPNPITNGLATVRVVLIDSRTIGWMPHAMMLALCLATRLTFRRTAGLLLFGVLAANLLALATVLACVWSAILTDSSPAWQRWLGDTVYQVLVTNLWMSFAGPFLMWVMLYYLLDRYDPTPGRQSAGTASAFPD